MPEPFVSDDMTALDIEMSRLDALGSQASILELAHIATADLSPTSHPTLATLWPVQSFCKTDHPV